MENNDEIAKETEDAFNLGDLYYGTGTQPIGTPHISQWFEAQRLSYFAEICLDPVRRKCRSSVAKLILLTESLH